MVRASRFAAEPSRLGALRATQLADQEARCRPHVRRPAVARRELLLQHQKFVKGLGVWDASVGAVLSEKGCLHHERRPRDPEAPPSLVIVKAQPPTLQERAKATNQLYEVR
eukprot:5801297-Pyramimonas_sp.AAC.1